jgi:hypothetical protein
MITVTIGKKKYKGIYSWEEMTLAKFTELASIPIPSGYEAYIVADGNFSTENIDKYIDDISKITAEQLAEFSTYYRKVITCLTGIPESAHIPLAKVNELYDWYFKPFVVTMIYHVPVVSLYGKLTEYTPDRLTDHFVLNGDKYYLPESVLILDDLIPLQKEPAITYSEANDLFRGMKIGREDVNRLALFMSIYCRLKDEKYDEQKALERKDLMCQASMSIVWSVFFCIVTRLRGSINQIRSFGKHPKTLEESVSEAKTYRASVVGGLSMSVQDMEVMAQ